MNGDPIALDRASVADAVQEVEIKDPVCGMTVKPESPYESLLKGTRCRFCSAKCKTKFDARPDQYLNPAPVTIEAPSGTEYLCPTHAEVRQTGPGTCPKCGMALEPVMPELDQGEENIDYWDFWRRCIACP